MKAVAQPSFLPFVRNSWLRTFHLAAFQSKVPSVPSLFLDTASRPSLRSNERMDFAHRYCTYTCASSCIAALRPLRPLYSLQRCTHNCGLRSTERLAHTNKCFPAKPKLKFVLPFPPVRPPLAMSGSKTFTGRRRGVPHTQSSIPIKCDYAKRVSNNTFS